MTGIYPFRKQRKGRTSRMLSKPRCVRERLALEN